MDEIQGLVANFTANTDDWYAAVEAAGATIDVLAEQANAASAEISESITGAAESFSSITEGASQISASVEENVAGAEEALSTLGASGEESSSELNSSIEQATTGFAQLQDAIASLTGAVGDAVTQINEQIDSIGTNAEESASQTQSSFSGFDLGGMVTSVGMGIFSLQAIGTMATQTGTALLGPASAAENTQASFTNLLGSTQAASNELGKLNDFAAKTQFKTQDIDNMASSMIAFKTPTADIIPRLTAVGDALTAVERGTPAEMQSVVDVLGKMGIQGKLTQGDITQLGVHGINALDLIAEGSGKTTKEIQDMVKNGTLPANDAIDALTKGIENNPVYSGGMAKQANTLSGQMSTLQSNWNQAMAAFGSPVLTAIEPELNNIGNAVSSPAFKQFAQTVGQDIVTALGNASQFFSAPAFKQFADLVGGQLGTGVKNLANYLDSPSFANFAKIAGQDIANALLTTTQDVENIVSWFIQWHEPILIVGGVLTALFIPAIIQSGVESVIAGGKMAVAYVKNIIDTGVEGWKAAIHIGEWVVGVIASGVQAGIAGVKIAADFVGGLIASGVQSSIAAGKVAVEFVGSLIKAGVQAGLTAIKFTAELIPSIISFVAETAVAVATSIPGIIAGFGAWVVAMAPVVLETLLIAAPYLLIAGVVIGAIALIILAIQHWSDIVKFFQGVWSVVWGAVSGFFVGIWHDITGFFQNAINFIIDNAATFGRILFLVITGPIGLLALFIFDHWNQIWSFLMGIWKNIKDGFSDVESFFTGIGMALYHGFINGIDLVIAGINDFITGLDAIQIHIPAVGVGPVKTPSFDWGGLGIALIPKLASGGTVPPGGAAIVGDPTSSELVYGGTSGLSVFSHSQTQGMLGGNGGETHIHLYLDSRELSSILVDPLMTQVVKRIRLQGGVALGV